LAPVRREPTPNAALDTFYLTQQNGNKVLSLDHQQFIADQIRAAISKLDDAG